MLNLWSIREWCSAGSRSDQTHIGCAISIIIVNTIVYDCRRRIPIRSIWFNSIFVRLCFFRLLFICIDWETNDNFCRNLFMWNLFNERIYAMTRKHHRFKLRDHQWKLLYTTKTNRRKKVYVLCVLVGISISRFDFRFALFYRNK